MKFRAQATGSTVSELIRAVIDDVYTSRRGVSTTEQVRVAERTAGAWKDFPETGAEYVGRVRGSRRLSRLTERTAERP